jgi:hypothetical protein
MKCFTARISQTVETTVNGKWIPRSRVELCEDLGPRFLSRSTKRFARLALGNDAYQLAPDET